MDAARPLRSMLDRLAALRWAPLAADAVAAELLAGPAARLAGLAPDPLQALGRVTNAPQAGAAAAAQEARVPRSAALHTGGGGQTQALKTAGPGPVPGRRSVPASIDAPLPSFRAAQPSTPLLPMLARSVEPPPLLQTATAPPVLPTGPAADRRASADAGVLVEADALLQRFAAAASAPPLSAQRLREWVHPQPRPARPAPPGQAATAAATQALAELVPQRPAAGAAAAAQAVRAPTATARAEPPPTAAALAIGTGAPPQRARSTAAPEAAPDALPVPRGRTSALSDLLRRWPGAAGPGDEAAGARSQLAAALPTPDTATPAWPAGPQPAAAPAQPADLARPALPASDLLFGRTLERVLLAEVRRQGLDVEPE